MKSNWRLAMTLVVMFCVMAVLGGCGDGSDDSGLTAPDLFSAPDPPSPDPARTPTNSAPRTTSSATVGSPIQVQLGMLSYQPLASLVVATTPLAYTAFSLTELRTRSALPALKETDMVTLRDGSRISVKNFLPKLNAWETTFAARGVSLRDSRATVRREAVRTDAAALNRSADTIRAAHTDLGVPNDLVDGLTSSTADIFSQPVRTPTSLTTAKLQASLLGKSATSYTRTRTWDFTPEGETDRFSVYLRGELTGSVSLDGAEVHGSSQAGGTVFGRNITIASAEGSIVSPASGDASVDLDLVLAGQSIDLSEHLSTPSWDADVLSLNDSASHPVDYNASFSWPVLGIINVTGTIGAAGEAGFEYSVIVDQLSAAASFAATASVEVYGEIGAAVSLGITVFGLDLTVAEISGGVGASLTLIEDELEFAATMNVAMDGSWNDWALEYNCYGTNEMTMLSGEFYVWAKADFPWPCNWADHRWEETLFEWDGVTVNNDLFDVEGSVPLFQ